MPLRRNRWAGVPIKWMCFTIILIRRTPKRLSCNNRDNLLVPFLYNNEIWKRLNAVICNRVGTAENGLNTEGSDFTISPNPSTSSSVEFSQALTGYLMNSLGQVLIKFSNPTTTLSVQNLPNGVYFVKANGYKTKRLVIQK